MSIIIPCDGPDIRLDEDWIKDLSKAVGVLDAHIGHSTLGSDVGYDAASRLIELVTVVLMEAVTAKAGVRRTDLLTKHLEGLSAPNVTAEELLAEAQAGKLVPFRYLLLEESNITGEWAASIHASIDEALAYNSDQECAEDWDPKEVIDLDTGDSKRLYRRFVTEVDG